MKCPRCDQKTFVASSRCADSPNGCQAASNARKAISWYTDDWVARRRKCNHCGWSGQTVEILLDDLKVGWKKSTGPKP